METPTRALSIRQPWCWLILHAGKDVENRTWATTFRGPFLIHASKGFTLDEYDQCCEFLLYDPTLFKVFDKLPTFEYLKAQCGGFVGQAVIAGCYRHSPTGSPWFTGPYGFMIQDAKPMPFYPAKGALRFFKP